jgi:hypothetical protein
MKKPTHPPAYVAADVWEALDYPPELFDGYYARNGWATTWAVLMSVLRDKPQCEGVDDEGKPCVLRKHPTGPHHSIMDVGSTEPLPHQRSDELAALTSRVRELESEIKSWEGLDEIRRDRIYELTGIIKALRGTP